jgi:hypothetical protein
MQAVADVPDIITILARWTMSGAASLGRILPPNNATSTCSTLFDPMGKPIPF